MSKQLTINSNNYVREYTTETDVNSLKLTGSVPNLLPYDIWHAHCAPYNMPGLYDDLKGIYHFDWTRTWTNIASRKLILFEKVYDYVEIKPGSTYTFAFRVSNITGTYNAGTMNVAYAARNLTTSADTTTIIGNFTLNGTSPVNQAYKFTFTVPDNVLVTNLYLAYDFLQWNTTSRDLKFDLEFLGLFQGTYLADHTSNSLGDTPEWSSDTSNAVLGDYMISTDVLRHLKQVERHIAAYNNKLDITIR